MHQRSKDGLVSIVVPTLNRSASLEALLCLLTDQDIRTPWEIVVVINGEPRDALGIVSSFRDRLRVRCIEEPVPGAGRARNVGIRAALGDLILFLDDDMRPRRDLVRLHAEAAHEYNAWVVGDCPPTDNLQQTPLAAYVRSLSSDRIEGPSDAPIYTSQNSSAPRLDLIELGGYRERFHGATCEDADLYVRALNAGKRIIFDPRIVAFHDDWALRSFESFCRRQFLYGQAAPLLARLHGQKNPYRELASRNAPLNLQEDAPALAVHKLKKAILAKSFVHTGTVGGAIFFERWWPKPVVLWPLYRAGLAGAIARGVRSGTTVS